MADDNVQGLNAQEAESDQETTDPEIAEGENATEVTKAEEVITKEQLEKEKSKVQSAFERKLASEKKEKESLTARLAEYDKLMQMEQARRKRAEEEAEAREEEEIAALPEGQKLIAWRRKLKDREDKLTERESLADQKYTAGEYGLKVIHAHTLAEENGLDDWKALLDAKTENDMKVKALELKIKQLQKTEPKETKKKEPEKKDETEDESITPVHVDSGVRTTGQPKRLFSLKEIESMDLATYAKHEAQILKQLGDGNLKEK